MKSSVKNKYNRIEQEISIIIIIIIIIAMIIIISVFLATKIQDVGDSTKVKYQRKLQSRKQQGIVEQKRGYMNVHDDICTPIDRY